MNRPKHTQSLGRVNGSYGFLGEFSVNPLRSGVSGPRIRPMVDGSTIKRLRGIAGWSQQQLADAANCEQTTISDFELGKTKPQARTLAKIVAALRAKLGPDFDADDEEVENSLLRRAVMKLTMQLARSEDQRELAMRELDHLRADQRAKLEPAEPPPEAEPATSK